MFRYRLHPDDPRCAWDPLVDPVTSRHIHMFGNRRFQVQAGSDGTVAVWDTSNGFRWLTADEPGTGHTIVTDVSPGDEVGRRADRSVDREGADDAHTGRRTWGSALADWPEGAAPVRTFGPTWFAVEAEHDGLRLNRTVLCPEGDHPWLVIRVVLESNRWRRVRLTEQWHVATRFVNRHLSPATQRAIAAGAIRFDASTDMFGATLVERRLDPAVWLHLVPNGAGTAMCGTPETVRIATDRASVAVDVEDNGSSAPTVTLTEYCDVEASREETRWFVVGLGTDGREPPDPAGAWRESFDRLARRLPTAHAPLVPALRREVPWHAAVLTGGACIDRVLGDHTLDQASAYSFRMGFNGAARDPLQHALPLVYIEPDLALSVLRNTCSWARPSGELPYALGGAKEPLHGWYDPSDQALWSLWLAAEYLAATGHLEAFRTPVGFHPCHGAEPAPLGEHLVRQFRHLIDVIGFGAHGHIRIRNADWNDAALVLSGLEPALMAEHGESVLNSAMAAWVLPRYASVARRLGDTEVADEAEQVAERLRQLVASEWNGRWFRRAYGPGTVLGDADLWLETQPWAMLCGAADPQQSRDLLATIDAVLRDGSPLGARVRGPAPVSVPPGWFGGEATAGGVWYSINMTLAWAAARIDPQFAWDELERMTLDRHTSTYPSIWEGTISGPDSYNSPESPRPGHTWGFGSSVVAMQAFPIGNLHSHAQVLLTYLRLLGVEPAADGALLVGLGGGSFTSPVLELDSAGHGRLRSRGAVQIQTPSRRLHSEGGDVSF